MNAAGSTVDMIVLDLFGVVLDFDNELVVSRLAARCADPDVARRRLDGLTGRRDVIVGASSLAQIHEELAVTLDLAATPAEFEAMWLEPYSWGMPGMAQVLRHLAARHTLVLLSNVDRYYWGVVRAAHPELDCFTWHVLSFDVGVAKPDAEIFRYACRLAGTEPSRCFFVDDSRDNVDAARALGFRAHRFRGVAGLRASLARAGISTGR